MISRENRYCPIAGKEITEDVCYEVVMCLTSGFSPSSVPEVEFKADKETLRICSNCQYGDWD